MEGIQDLIPSGSSRVCMTLFCSPDLNIDIEIRGTEISTFRILHESRGEERDQIGGDQEGMLDPMACVPSIPSNAVAVPSPFTQIAYSLF